MTANTLSPALAAELDRLNDEQRDVALHVGNLAVQAGPGSGKTRTLVAKVGYLLEAHVPRWQGVAAITFTRPAAREMTDRLAVLGVQSGRRLNSATVHGWCLNAILRPYGPMLGVPSIGPDSVIESGTTEWNNILQSCLDDLHLSTTDKTIFTRIRRTIAAGEAVDENNAMVKVARRFDEKLLERGWFDFDSMVAKSLQILQLSPRVSHLVAVRYPWLIVDEYQDLGPVLHQLVLHMHDKAGVKIAAFGDPDQTIMSFLGADPRYLRELAARPDFHAGTLSTNYRCGQAIIAASHVTLDEKRAHHADPNRNDPGLIEHIYVEGDIPHHAHAAVRKIRELTAGGIPAHRIAVLYPSKGPILDALLEEFHMNAVDYIHDKDGRLPEGNLADFIRDCAARAVFGPQPSDYDAAPPRTINELIYEYNRLRVAGGLTETAHYAVSRDLVAVVNRVNTDEPLAGWVSRLSKALDLELVAAKSLAQRDKQALQAFHAAGTVQGMTVNDAAGFVRVGKVTLATYHGSKAREWDVVILPGLVDSLIPRCSPFNEPSSSELASQRRMFYVGLTRARYAVVLVYGDHWISRNGRRMETGVSRFVAEILSTM
ncbi:ATP-dependent helicase [Streptosporangium sp. NPDC006930]|uniref:ATP-dependent helicase n=1 Tax=Streptosporangium sp. NPDC006930 TaxID=3154783 RepID=UPI00343C92B4